jgi:N-formylglutamate deformylase
VRMELACRGYLDEPQGEVDLANWPCPWDDAVAAPMRAVLQQVLSACLAFAAAARA